MKSGDLYNDPPFHSRNLPGHIFMLVKPLGTTTHGDGSTSSSWEILGENSLIKVTSDIYIKMCHFICGIDDE